MAGFSPPRAHYLTYSSEHLLKLETSEVLSVSKCWGLSEPPTTRRALLPAGCANESLGSRGLL